MNLESLMEAFRFETCLTTRCLSWSLTIEQIAFALCRGGWPASVRMKGEDAMEPSRNYVDAIIHQDVSRVDGVERNPKRVQLLLRSLARNITTMATNVTILKDMEGDEKSMSAPTLDAYLNALRRIFVIEDLPAWSPSMMGVQLDTHVCLLYGFVI